MKIFCESEPESCLFQRRSHKEFALVSLYITINIVSQKKKREKLKA